eukprot:3144736-Pleurochrysis_carterae.AAC.1
MLLMAFRIKARYGMNLPARPREGSAQAVEVAVGEGVHGRGVHGRSRARALQESIGDTSRICCEDAQSICTRARPSRGRERRDGSGCEGGEGWGDAAPSLVKRRGV